MVITHLSDLEVGVLDELGSGLQSLLGSPQLVPAEVSPRWPQACSLECVGWTVLQDVFWVFNASSTRALIIVIIYVNNVLQVLIKLLWS